VRGLTFSRFAALASLGISQEAARFLMRKFQEGVTDEIALAEAL
jgi:hypothetical protein